MQVCSVTITSPQTLGGDTAVLSKKHNRGYAGRLKNGRKTYDGTDVQYNIPGFLIRDFFAKVQNGEWNYMGFQAANTGETDDDYREKLNSAIEWCKNNCKNGEWHIYGNDFIFKQQLDAAAFCFTFM